MITPILVDSAEAEILRVLRKQGQISRTQISTITGWSKAKTTQEIRKIVEKGYLVEVGEGASQGGRKPRLLRLNDRLGIVVGIDIGASSIEVALADVSGKVLQRRCDVMPVNTRECRSLISPDRGNAHT